MWKSIALAAALALAGTGAVAQGKKELVQKVLQLQQPGIEAVARGIAGQAANQVLQVAAQALRAAPGDKREAAAKDIQASVRKFHDEVEPLLRKRAVELAPGTIGAVLESRFSDDELRQLIAWLESPVARKYEQAAPEMQQALAQKLVAESKGAVDPKIKALEESVVKRLQAAGVPLTPASAPKK